MRTPYVQPATKTTFFLADSRRARLKSLAIERGTTVTELLAEGVSLILEKYERVGDKAALLERAENARRKLREGLFEGPSSPEPVDDVVYGTAPRAHGSARKSRSRKR